MEETSARWFYALTSVVFVSLLSLIGLLFISTSARRLKQIIFVMVSIAVSASIEDVRSHTIIWQEGGIGSVFVASYPVTIGDITATKIAKETAIRKASQDVAWTLRSRVLEGF